MHPHFEETVKNRDLVADMLKSMTNDVSEALKILLACPDEVTTEDIHEFMSGEVNHMRRVFDDHYRAHGVKETPGVLMLLGIQHGLELSLAVGAVLDPDSLRELEKLMRAAEQALMDREP